MTTVVAAGRRVLPRGYADLARQLVIWFGFLFVYQIARGFADRNPAKAFANGIRVIDFEQRTTHHLFELTFQNLVDSSSFLAGDLVALIALTAVYRRPIRRFVAKAR